MKATNTDVLIVGAGVIGLCCAYELLQAGRSVRVLERSKPGAGASHGNCGTITPSHAPPLAAPGVIGQALRWMTRHDAPLYIRPRLDPKLWSWLARFAGRCNARDWWASAQAKAVLLQASRQRLPDLLAEAAIDCEFETTGLLYAYRDAATYARQLPAQLRLPELGIEVEVWDADRLLAEEPSLLPGAVGGVFFPGDAVLRPDRYLAGLLRAVFAAGGEVISGAEVRRIDPDAGEVSCADGRRFAARHLLLAGGAWTPQFARQLGLRIPIVPGKGYSITYERPALAPRRPLVLRERSVCVTSWGSGYRLGSTMEFSGYDNRLNPVRLAALQTSAREYLIEPEGPKRVEDWYGWRPMTFDDVPLIGPLPRFPRCLIAAGHGMMGVSMSAATGRLIADLIVERSPHLDPRPYAAARFAA